MRNSTGILCALFCCVSGAHASVLTFDITDLYTNLTPRNAAAIPDAYGDRIGADSVTVPGFRFNYLRGFGWTEHIVVDYATVNAVTQQPYKTTLDFQNRYNPLRNVATAGAGQGYFGQITLQADPGYLVRLNSFDLASWNNSVATATSTEVNGTSQNVTIQPGSAFSYANRVEAATILIRFGYNSTVIGIDNIDFDEIVAPPPAAETPEVGTLFLVGSALLGAGMLRKNVR